MFFIISKITAFLLNPLTWIIILLIAGLIFKNPKRKKRINIAAVICVLLFTNPAIIDEIIRCWEEPYSVNDKTQSYEAGVVLGGGMVTIDFIHDRLIFHENTDRFLQALHLYKCGQIKKIILSGGSGSLVFKDFLEGPLIKRYLLDIGVPDSVILVDSTSNNTYQNAVNCAAIIKTNCNKGQFLLITSAMHMKRSKACFAKQGIDAISYPTNKLVGLRRTDIGYYLIPEAEALVRWEKYLHEVIGYLVYKIMGYV
ncbi:MAG TPA: YdcF family protein [Bacteroidales bacterium]|nr:YdcF family protein [Bacteroidales bacterium]